MDRRIFLTVFVVAFIAGAWLRLHGVMHELIVSDEWHGLHAATLLDYGELFSLLTPGATSIPLNLYYKALLDTVGWSELGLRLPSLLAGIAALVVLPIASRRWLGIRARMMFGALLAVSPMLIFYSRYSRPYALVSLLAFTGLIACHSWWRTGRVRYALGFIVAGVLSAWLHVVEIRMVVLPLAYYTAVWLVGRRGDSALNLASSRGYAAEPGLRGLVIVGAAAMATLGLLLLPAMLSGGGAFAKIMGKGWVDWRTVWGAAELLVGTWQPLVSVLLLALAAWGVVALLRRDSVFAGLLLTMIVGAFATVIVTHPRDSQLPIVFARYVIPALAPILLFVALGLDEFLVWLETRTALSWGVARRLSLCATFAIAIALPVSLFFHGPLLARVSKINNFSNNKSFHVSHAPLEAGETYFSRLSQAFGKSLDFVPKSSPFYDSLAVDSRAGAVIEYPVPIGDMFSALPDYQQIHGKRVIGGYRRIDAHKRARVRPGLVISSWRAGMIFGAVEEPAALRFEGFVNVDDVAAVRGTGARYLIVHRNPSREARGQPPKSDSPIPSHLVDAYGSVVYEDDWLFVFDLDPDQLSSGR